MKNQWLEFFSGTVSVKVSGKGIERFINQLLRNGITIWDVKRYGVDTVVFHLKLGDVKKIRPLARNSECKIVFQQRIGMPFLLKQMLRNSGLLAGAILFLFVIILLSNMVWRVEVKGANPATEHKIYKQLDKMGIKPGKLQFFIDDVETVQRKLTNEIQVITWVGVELRGTTFHLEVVEKKEPKKTEVFGPRHLVAKKEAVISKIYVEKGQKQVELNQHVQKGQLLVSGIIGKEEKTEIVSATGEVFGETWYKSTVELPIKSTFQVFNGNEKMKYSIKMGKVKIPVWGFGKPKYPSFTEDTTNHKLRFLKWELPISFVDTVIREKEEVTRIYSEEEATEVAMEIARKDIKSKLSEDAIIKGENVLHQAIENGKVTLSIHFQIIEDIAEEQPIIQGDEE
ncbi:sporulation protein YqfD [Bacillus sp. DNRA2]|uniref:sporulation protein YqfD n=1 Tax=Bacillus sp. DNRA2 TaxID=2723053 RepID=UPI00145FA1BB|nr:sporulation protein YqfD [Bacillus sp. DNRA2]NMD70660.1 sporulation protein YqfD [Bacillus sp. DNRA2]